MQKIHFTLIILFISIQVLTAQEPDQTTKKIIQSDENKLFINKNLGLYIWISDSPDENSKKYRLLSDSSKKYSNPMYLDTEGYNTLRSPSAVDTATKQTIFPLQDIIFDVYADGLAPVSQSKHISKSTNTIQGKKYFGSDLKIELNSNDKVSGVENIKFALNGNAYTNYIEPISSFKEGENTLRYYATDKVGNREEVKTETLFIDNAPPTTEYEIEGMLNEKFVSPNAIIKLKSSDNLAGVSAIYYKINGGKKQTYISPIPVSVLGSNEGSISFWAEDKLGNIETERIMGGKNSNLQIQGATSNMVFEFYVDKEPPVVNIEIEGDVLRGKNQYISGRTKLIITANDEKSGLDKIYYSFNSSLVDQEYSQPILYDKEGIFNLRVKSNDFVGNTSPILTNVFVCDLSAPTSKISIGSPKFSSRDTLFIASITPLKITAEDALSGVASMNYLIDNNTSKSYVTDLTLNESGFHTIRYSATDKVNNTNTENKLEVFVDNLPPNIYYHFSVEAIGNKTVREEPYTIYPANAMLYIASTDASSGGERIVYSINEGPSLTENPLKGFVPGNYQVHVKAYDVLGNENILDIKFSIEK